ADALRTQEHISQRKLLIQAAADAVTPPALLKLTQAAGVAYDRPVSKPLDSLLIKLAREAETLPPAQRAHADHAFRSLVRQIVEAWSATTIDLGSSNFHALFETEYDPLQS